MEASCAIVRILRTFPNIELPPNYPTVPIGQEKQLNNPKPTAIRTAITAMTNRATDALQTCFPRFSRLPTFPPINPSKELAPTSDCECRVLFPIPEKLKLVFASMLLQIYYPFCFI